MSMDTERLLTGRSTVVANSKLLQHEPKSGTLEVFAETGFIAAASWKKRWVSTNLRRLIIYKDEKGEKKDKPLMVIDLEGCSVKQYVSNRKKHAFQIFHKTKAMQDIILGCSSQQEMEEWMRAVQNAIEAGAGAQLPVIPTLSSCEIQPADLDWSNEVLGKGGSGLVKKGLWLKSIPVAIKTLNNIPEFIDDHELESFFKEMAILSEMRHPNVVSMFGFCRKDSYLCLVTEYITGGDLSACLKDKGKQLPVSLKLELALSISAAMIYLHKMNLIHRDLKPGNILIEDWEIGKVKVCDFGLSRIKTPDEKTMTIDMFGSPAYAAPELNSSDHSNKVDVFSFAIILWEIDTRQPAWANLAKAWEITEAIAKGQRMEVNPQSPFASLITRCWDADPNRRPNFEDIYNELTVIKSSNKFPPLPSRNSVSPLTKRVLPPHPNPTNNVPNPTPVQPAPTSQRVPSSPSMTNLTLGVNDPGRRILIAFRQPVISWDDFVKSYLDAMGYPSRDLVEKLKFVLTDGGYSVQRASFEQFLRWFSPLVAEPDTATYANVNAIHKPPPGGNPSSNNTGGNGGYTTQQIAEIVGPSWFHGWLSPDDSKTAIGNASEGTFLFRFSQSPKCYSLSVMHLGNVTHWRITSQKDTDQGPAVFKIDTRSYSSIQDIVTKHAVEPLKVFQLLSTGKEDVFLKQQVPRAPEAEQQYANVPGRGH